MKPLPVDEDIGYIASGKLKGKVAIVTGGDSGIGRSVALLFAKEGADICIVYLNEHEDADLTIARIEKFGGRVIQFDGDLANPNFCEEVVQRTINAYGKIDILINNAGEQDAVTGVEEMNPAHVEKIFRNQHFQLFLSHQGGTASFEERGGHYQHLLHSSLRSFTEVDGLCLYEGRNFEFHAFPGQRIGGKANSCQCGCTGTNLDTSNSNHL